MKEINKLRQELMIMRTLEIKANYSELARIHECDRRTVEKYDEGYEGKLEHRNKISRLDKYKNEKMRKLIEFKQLLDDIKYGEVDIKK